MPVKTFTPIPYSNPDLNAPGRGAEQWHDRVDVNVPVEGTRTIPRDRYQRFVATRIAGATKGSYNWTFFDNLVKECITNNQLLNFGYMTVTVMVILLMDWFSSQTALLQHILNGCIQQ
jgi:hypothetical protein